MDRILALIIRLVALATPDHPVRIGSTWHFGDGTTLPVLRGGDGPEPDPDAEAITALLTADASTLSDEDLAAAETSLTDAFAAYDLTAPTADDLAELTAITEAIERVRVESTTRAAAAEANAAAAAELAARVTAETTPPEGEDPPADDTATDDDATDDTEDAPADAEGVLVTAAADPPPPVRLTRLAARRAQRHAAPAPLSELAVITAAGDVPDFSAGSAMTLDDVGRAFWSKAQAMSRMGGNGHAAIARVHFPRSEHALSAKNSAADNADVITAAVQEWQSETAAGGLCAPTEARYDVPVYSHAGRPVRDALVRVNGDRGGLRYQAAPTLSLLSGAVDIITEAEDAASATKPCLTITCGEDEEVTISAVPLCLQDGNFTRRTFPERFDGWWALGTAQHAREAETNLLDLIAAGSTAVTDALQLGTARDLLTTWGRARAGMVNRHRAPRNTVVRLLAPAWSIDAIRADLVRELPGSTAERLATAEAEIDRFFAAHHLNVTLYEDTETGTGQLFAAQPVGALVPWPSNGDVVSYMFFEGSWLFVDGGELDFGMEIRDSTLNAANNVRAMLETFEAAAFVGVESLKITQTTCPTGATSASVTVDCTPAS